tara:strand:- start:18015 stop:19568 length:1554 start_codon:yes stop_codon:yes gene_type:complete
MIKKKDLEKYCKDQLLEFEIIGLCLLLNSKVFKIVDSEQTLFDEDFDFLPLLTEEEKGGVDGHVYQFCGIWYLQNTEDEEVKLTPIKNIGAAKQKIKTDHFLGIHSGMELLNGVGLYADWIKKAKFLGIKTLGICEKDSVGGSLDFQKQCLKNDIKPIIGITINVKSGTEIYSVKCYCKDFIGWQNLLKFTYKLNVNSEPNIEQQFLIDNSDGLCIVIDPKSSNFNDYKDVTNFYQLDTVSFEEENKDIEYANNLKEFLKSDMQPILIFDAYHIEKDEWKAREKLWGIAKSYDYKSKNQYLKNNDQFAIELMNLFVKGNNSWFKLFNEAKNNLNKLVEECNFTYDTTSRHLPKYQMTEEESKTFSTNEQLFLHFIKTGFKTRGVKAQQKYIDRLKKEINVLKDGDVIDYFLITRDIIMAAKENDTLVGLGRGSAGGCLVSYLLGIIEINPMELDLIFERFLNPGRMGSLNDCDAYVIQTDTEVITLNEKSILKIMRNQKEINIFVEDLVKGDEILKY